MGQRPLISSSLVSIGLFLIAECSDHAQVDHLDHVARPDLERVISTVVGFEYSAGGSPSPCKREGYLDFSLLAKFCQEFVSLAFFNTPVGPGVFPVLSLTFFPFLFRFWDVFL